LKIEKVKHDIAEIMDMSNRDEWNPIQYNLQKSDNIRKFIQSGLDTGALRDPNARVCFKEYLQSSGYSLFSCCQHLNCKKRIKINHYNNIIETNNEIHSVEQNAQSAILLNR